MDGAIAVKADYWTMPNKVISKKLIAIKFHPVSKNPKTNYPNLLLFKLNGNMDNVAEMKKFFPEDISGNKIFLYKFLRLR